MEKIKLSDIIMAYLDFKEKPSEQTEKGMTGYRQYLQIREYLPLLDKQVAMALILDKVLPQEKDAVATQMNLEIATTVYGLLGYAVNLENDLGYEALLNSAIYDALYESGFVDYLLQYCGADYARLKDMIAGACNFSNIFKITEVAALMSPENLNEFIKVTKELDLAISSDKVKELARIYEASDPDKAALVEAFRAAAVNKVMTKVTKATDEPVAPAVPVEKAEEAPASTEEKSEEKDSSAKA